MNKVQQTKLSGGFSIIYSNPSVKSIFFTRRGHMELVGTEQFRYLQELASYLSTAGVRYQGP